MEAFEITVEFKSPVILGSETFWTLDGVCHGILEEMRELGLVDLDPLEAVPIKSEDGLFLASKAAFRGAVKFSNAKIGGIRTVRDLHDADELMQNDRKRFPKVITHRGRFKGQLSRYTEIAARAVTWSAVGDPEKVAALLLNAKSLGGLRKDGYGQIAEVSFDVDHDIDPVLEDGVPLRPIPTAHPLAARVRPGSLEAEASWRPRYFDRANVAACYVPST